MTYPRKPAKTCEHSRCILKPTEGKWCWFHAQVAAGLIDPAIPASHDKNLLEQVRRSEMSRLKAELNA